MVGHVCPVKIPSIVEMLNVLCIAKYLTFVYIQCMYGVISGFGITYNQRGLEFHPFFASKVLEPHTTAFAHSPQIQSNPK